MKIGLVRHFRVDIKKNIFMNAKEYNEYSVNYDKAGVITNELVIDKDWDKCYCSSLSRAVTTAKTIYDGEIIITEKLAEIKSMALYKLYIKLPYHIWAWLNHIGWFRNHVSHPEGREITIKRLNEIMNIIMKEKDKNILIVSHAGTMFELQNILKRKGFIGKTFIKARNGKLYIFEKKD